VNGKKGYLTCPGLDPSGCRKCVFKIALARVEHLNRVGPTHKFYELISAAKLLEEPMAIFEGLRREGLEHGLCYVGTPRCYREGAEHPPHPGMVFLVFVTKDMMIFEWGWEKEDQGKPGFPQSSRTRFDKCLWKHSSSM
jgi:hypothetical protein